MIAFSHDIFQMQRFGGVSRCIYQIARVAARTRDVTIFSGDTANAYLLDGVAEGSFGGTFAGTPADSVRGRLRGALRWEPRFARWLRDRPGTIVHRSYYAPYDLTPRGVPVVETLHDMGWERLAGLDGLQERANSVIKRRALERADAIACVSQHTLRDLAEVWPALAVKAVVIPHGVAPLSAAPVACGEDRPFFLYVGSREERKNFGVLLAALADNPPLSGVDLVCVGGGGWTAHEKGLLRDKGLTPRVRQKNLDDDELAGHFEAAIALLYPSFYEGFGMPLLEAMVNECPVISSNSTALPEAGGDGALYCPPDSVEAWREAMVRVASDSGLRADLRRRGAARARQCTWETAGRRYIRLYDELAGNAAAVWPDPIDAQSV